MVRRRRGAKSPSTKRPKKQEDKPLVHHKTTHGGYTAVKKYRERSLDLRRADDRAIKAWQDAVVTDCGGLEAIDAFQSTLLDQCTQCMIILAAISEYATKTGIMDEKTGDVIPCLKNTYTQYLSTFKSTMQIIFHRAGKKMAKSSEPPDLNNYIEAQYGELK